MEPQQPLQPETFSQPQFVPQTSPPSQRQKLLVGGGILIFVLVLIIAATVLMNSTSPLETNIVKASSRQVQILRLLDSYSEDAKQLETQNLIARAKLLLSSDNKQLRNYLSTNFGRKLASEDLTELKLSTYEKELETATQNNSFDATFIESFSSLLDDTSSLLKTIRADSDSSELSQIVDQTLVTYESLL